jgi:hypothetical protein
MEENHRLRLDIDSLKTTNQNQTADRSSSKCNETEQDSKHPNSGDAVSLLIQEAVQPLQESLDQLSENVSKLTGLISDKTYYSNIGTPSFAEKLKGMLHPMKVQNVVSPNEANDTYIQPPSIKNYVVFENICNEQAADKNTFSAYLNEILEGILPKISPQLCSIGPGRFS